MPGISDIRENQSSLQFLSPQGYLQNRNITILIVDDSPVNLHVLSATLSEHDYDLRCAKSGATALKAIQAELPDLILLDVRMPDMDGYEICDRLKSDPRTEHIPIIFISALGDALDKVKAFSVGGADYITKPFQVEEVLARIRNQLNFHTAKIQLAHTEKMASLGQLMTGIAHEIKNPINFISGNVDCIAEDLQAILDILELYKQHFPQPPEAIQTKCQAIDLDYLQQDLPKIMRSIKGGTHRIIDIIQSLHHFSHIDNTHYQTVDIHDGIESTLLMLGHRLNNPNKQVQVIKNFGKVPLVTCYPGMINQVFMNLIANAIDAIEHKITGMGTDEIITIQTQQVDADSIEIHIKDTGCGIAEKVQKQIFNPFFTTKPQGKGTGLGLAISYQIIVENHHGNLTFQSEPEQGTEFIIQLPINTELPVAAS